MELVGCPRQKIADYLMRASPLEVTVTNPGGGSSGGLTNTELRAVPVPISGTVTANVGTVPVTGSFFQATQPVSIASAVAVTGAFFQATQPVSGTITANAGSGTFAVSAAALPLPTGAATETTLAAISTKTPALGQAAMAASSPVVIASNQSAVPVSGTFFQATQPVSGAFFQATQPVSIAATVAVSGPLTDTQLRASAVPVSGTFFQATQPVSIAATVAVSGPLTDAQLRASVVPISGTVTITPPPLTKGSQGATGVSTQDLKDAGRTQFAAATVIGGVTCVTTEAMLSMVPVRAGVAAGGATSIAVTSGKTLRLTAIVFSSRSTSAAVLSARCALRMNPNGAAVATSPILAIASTTQQAAALAEAGDTCVVALPDGIEISGTQQVGLSQVCSAVTGVVYASLIGFEY